MTTQKIVISEEQRKEMQKNIEQTDAIFRLEGFEPDDTSRAIDAAVLDGRVTREQVARELVEYAKEHKTMEGFIQSRTWA